MTDAQKLKSAFVVAWIALVLALVLPGFVYWRHHQVARWLGGRGLGRTPTDVGLTRWTMHQYACHNHPDPNANCGTNDHISPPPPPPEW